jgi:hypothetical protein
MPNTNCLEGIRCPRCGYDNDFYIECRVVMHVTDEGTDSGNGDCEWDDESRCSCPNETCEYTGTLAHFRTNPITEQEGWSSGACVAEGLTTDEAVDALKQALMALNWAPRFSVGSTDSYASAAKCNRALRKAGTECCGGTPHAPKGGEP